MSCPLFLCDGFLSNQVGTVEQTVFVLLERFLQNELCKD